jgi:hypothetical protein
MRFTLCKLFLGVTMAALASAGMTLHTRLWAEAIVSFSIVLYTAVAISAFRSGGQSRAFRICFAAVGGGYLLLVLCNTFTPIRDLLVTNRALVLAGTAMHVPTDEFVGVTPLGWGGGGGGFQVADPGSGNSANEDLALITNTAPFNAYEYGWNNNYFAYGVPIANPQIPAGAFLIIGHCVWSWLIALAAGCFAAFVCRPRAAAVA